MNHYPPMSVFEDKSSQSHSPENEENFDRILTMQDCFGVNSYQDWRQQQ